MYRIRKRRDELLMAGLESIPEIIAQMQLLQVCAPK